MSLCRPNAPALSLPTAFSSSLPPPPILRNRSFARIAKLFGIGTSTPLEDDEYVNSSRRRSGSETGEANNEDEGDNDEADGEGHMDEMTLLLDAQAVLLSHQPSIASQYYAAAALPPYHSPAACLALGNVLLRGSSLAPNEIQADTNAQDKGEGKASSIKPSPISPVMVPRRSSEDSAIRSSPSNHPPYKAYRIFRVRLEGE